MTDEEIKKIRKFYKRRGFRKETIDELILVYERGKKYERKNMS